MVSGLAGIAIVLGVAASTGAFVRSALKKNKRPTIGSILVALFVVPFAAASVSGLATGPLELLGRVPGLSIVAWLVATAVLVVLCAIGGHFLASVMGERKGAQAGDVMRGAQLSTSDRWQKRTQRMLARDTGVVSLAGLAIDRADEPKHFLLMGTTGTGKSLAIREMLRGAEARGDRAIIADPDGSFLSRFYDPARGDVILNPFDARSAMWDMMGEVPNDFAAEQLAASLVPSPGGGADATWAARARTLLTAILRRGRLTGIDTAEVYRLFAVADRAELRTLLAGTAAEPFLAEGATKLFDSVRSSSGDAMSALEYASSATGGAPFSLTRWAADPNDRRWVFLPYRADQIAALKALIGPWMRLAIFATMSRPEGDGLPTWFVADELDAGNNLLLGLGSANVYVNKPLIPLTDNLVVLGTPSNRFTAVYAVNGTIQTSDARLKTDVTDIDQQVAERLLMSVTPKTFRWIIGGKRAVMRTEKQQVMTSVRESTLQMPTGRNPVSGNHILSDLQTREPVFEEVLVDVVDSYEDVPGKRIHAGFIASELRSAILASGLEDLGAYVKCEDGVEAIRPDQMIPILWSVVTGLVSKRDELEDRIVSMEKALMGAGLL